MVNYSCTFDGSNFFIHHSAGDTSINFGDYYDRFLQFLEKNFSVSKGSVQIEKFGDILVIVEGSHITGTPGEINVIIDSGAIRLIFPMTDEFLRKLEKDEYE